MAYNLLKNDYPDVLDQANSLLKVYTNDNPGSMPNENNYPFVECAPYADEIRYTNGHW